MYIRYIDFSNRINQNNTIKNNSSIKTSFTGQKIDKNADEQTIHGIKERNGTHPTTKSYTAVYNLVTIFNDPRSFMQNRLLSDGFSENDILKWGIYNSSASSNTETEAAKAFAEDFRVFEKEESKANAILEPKKENEDILAMQRIYSLLDKKFENADTENYKKAFVELSSVFKENFGTTFPEDKPIQDLILQILRYSNRYNEPVVRALLDNENFNNINIPQAIRGILTKDGADAALTALKEVDDAHFDKSFSLPLAIMLSNASSKNLPMIEKMLQEQDFLLADKNFVTQKLAEFLKRYDFLTVSYIHSEDMTLQEVSDIMDTESEEE